MRGFLGDGARAAVRSPRPQGLTNCLPGPNMAASDHPSIPAATGEGTPARDSVPRTSAEHAASYARKSDPKEEAILAQHATNADRARADGLHIPLDLCWGDDGTSGTTIRRAGLDALLGVISTGSAPFTRLYVRDRDRLARSADPRFPFFVEFLCKTNGVQLCYSTDVKHVEYGVGGDEGLVNFILAALKNVKAYQELVDTRMRTMRGTLNSLKRRRFVGARAPYGYDRWLVSDDSGAFVQVLPERMSFRLAGHHVGLRANAPEQVVVRRIFEGILARNAYAHIARELEAAGAPRPGREPWSPNLIRDIARNPIHMGDYVHGRTRHRGTPTPASEVNSEAHSSGAVLLASFVEEPPVSTADWTLAQVVMDGRAEVERQRKRSSPAYLLTSILRCAACGNALSGHRQALRGGVRVRMYRHCPARSRAGRAEPPCPHVNRYVPAEPLEAAALQATRIMLNSDEALRVARVELTRLSENTGSAAHHSALEESEAKFAAAMRAAAEANVRAARATSEIEQQIHDETVRALACEAEVLKTRVKALRAEQACIAEVEARLPAMEKRMASLVETFEAGTPDGQKTVVAAVVETMLVCFVENAVEIRVLAA